MHARKNKKYKSNISKNTIISWTQNLASGKSQEEMPKDFLTRVKINYKIILTKNMRIKKKKLNKAKNNELK